MFRDAVLCVIIRSHPKPESTRFYTDPSLPLQVGHVVYHKGTALPRHYHKSVQREIFGTGEVVVVQKGRASLDLYGNGETVVRTCELEAGDIAVLVSGGHGFRFSEDTVLLEVKQGPYDEDDDKIRF